MIFGMYSIFDPDINYYCTPFYSSSDAVALTEFSVFLSDVHNEYGSRGQKYSLYKVGSFNKNTGEVLTSFKFITEGVC